MRILTAALTASLILAACSSGPVEEPSASPATESPSSSPSSSPSPSPTPEAAFPLTGEATDEPRRDQPVVSVKIENTPSARPLAGIERADIVYEAIVEGGVTRFAALFHSDLPEEVGPVRSGRLIDVPVLEPWSSILVYSGARPDVTEALRSANHIGLLADPGHGPVFSRAPDRPGSHDLMADLPQALEQGRDLEDVAPVGQVPFTFDEDTPSGGTDEAAFGIQMTSASRAGWSWDADTQVYARDQNGQHLAVTGQGRIGAANVVAIVTDIGTGGCCDTAGNPFTVTRLEGQGQAVVWRDGQRFEATWRKADVGSHLQLFDEEGEPFPLDVGPTWFHLAGPTSVGSPG